MNAKKPKNKQKMNVVVDLGDHGQHSVFYSLDEQFCAVFPSGEQWRVMMSTKVSRKIAEAVKTQQNLEREPVVLYQSTLQSPHLDVPGFLG